MRIRLKNPEIHYHSCPECHVKHSCTMDCSLIDREGDKQCGGSHRCERCFTNPSICKRCQGEGYVGESESAVVVLSLDGVESRFCLNCLGKGMFQERVYP